MRTTGNVQRLTRPSDAGAVAIAVAQLERPPQQQREVRLGHHAVHRSAGRDPEHADLPIADVSNRMSRYAADYLGIADRGRLERGAWADLAVFDRDLNLTATYVEGESIVEYA